MKQGENNSAPTVSYLIEHAYGTCELWMKQTGVDETATYEPLKFQRLSGQGTVLLKAEMISEAIRLEEWMVEHMEVFREGLTSFK